MPFAALGILLGHLLTPDSIGPGARRRHLAAGAPRRHLVPAPQRTASCTTSAQYIPSYWLVQASHVALGGAAWSTMGWVVMVAWTVVLGVLAARAYRRDTGRI